MERKLKVGIIGCGPRGRYLFKAMVRDCNVEPVAACDLREIQRNRMQKLLEGELGVYGVRYLSDYKELLASEAEALIIATQIDSHADIAAEAMYAGKHVLCEIPIIKDTADAAKLLRATADNPKLKFMVAENCCYWGFINTWKKMYEDGLLGDVLVAEADYLHTTKALYDPKHSSPTTWRSHLHAINYLTHDLGPLLYILSDTCREVTGFIPDINPLENVSAPKNSIAIIKTTKGTVIKILIGFAVYQNGCNHNFVLYGTKGSVENARVGDYDDRGTYAHLLSIPHAQESIYIPSKAGYPGAKNQGGHGGADPRMLQAFVDCVLNDTKPPLDIEFGIHMSLPGLLAQQSYQNKGKTMMMPSIRDITDGRI